MDPVIAFGIGSFKALLLLIATAGVAFAFRKGPARLRAVVWATALVGCLLIPVISTVVPVFVVEVPGHLMPSLERSRPTHAPTTGPDDETSGVALAPDDPVTRGVAPAGGTHALRAPDLASVAAWVWAAVALALLLREGAGLVRMRRIVTRSSAVTNRRWLELAKAVQRKTGCRRAIDLVITPEVDIPSVYGVLRPAIVLPDHSDSWLEDRLEAVLHHEMVHLVRFDWPVRVVARVTRAAYWFNPLVWWAVRRLDLEQEMACDEEVLSGGSRPSTYACHLLSIARSAVARPLFVPVGLEMARRSHLEERIMTILHRSRHRRVGLAVILPAALLTATLVPAIAAMQPTEAAPKPASPELKAAIADMKEAEQALQPYLDEIEIQASDLEPIVEQIEAIEIDIDDEAIARIEAEMEPILAQIEAVEIDMEPIHEQLEVLHEQLETMTFHIDDGTMEEIQRQIHEQMEANRELLEAVHVDMAPFHEQLEALHEQLEPYRERLAELTEEQTARVREQLENNRVLMDVEREKMAQIREQMAEARERMAPVREEMERTSARIQAALVTDVADVLRSHLGSVTSPGAPFTEAAARIVDAGSIHIHDDLVEVDVSRSEVREILVDLFESHRVGSRDAFDAALDAAVDHVSELEILID